MRTKNVWYGAKPERYSYEDFYHYWHYSRGVITSVNNSVFISQERRLF